MDTFRVLVGLVLTMHFGHQLMTVPSLLEPAGLYEPSFVAQVGRGVIWGSTFGTLGEVGVIAWFAAGTFLSALVTVGWWPRTCATALLVLSVEAFWGLFPATLPDDRIVNLTLLWLVLLPTGHTLQLWRLRPGRAWGDTWRDWQRRRVPGPTVAAFGCQVAVLYFAFLLAPRHRLVSGPWVVGGALVVLAGLTAPWRLAHASVLVLCGLLHWLFYTRTQLLVTSGMLCAGMLLLLWPGKNTGPDPAARPRIGTGAILATTLVGLLGLNVAAAELNLLAPWHGTRRVLADLGVSPDASSLLGHATVRALRVESDEEHAGRRVTHEVGLENARERALANLFASPWTGSIDALRDRIAQRHAQRFCHLHPAFHGSAELRLERHDRTVAARAWLSCPLDPEKAPHVVVLSTADPGVPSL